MKKEKLCRCCNFFNSETNYCVEHKSVKPWESIECEYYDNYYINIKFLMRELGLDLFLETVRDIINDDSTIRYRMSDFDSAHQLMNKTMYCWNAIAYSKNE